MNPLREAYVRALEAYLEAPSEEALHDAYEIGKRFQHDRLGPEELVGLQMEVLARFPEIPQETLQRAFCILLETMMAYGMAHADAVALLTQTASETEEAKYALEVTVAELALSNQQLVEANAELAARNEALRRAEQETAELTRANFELHQLDQLRNQFVGIISHELRTPLNFMTGFASLLDDEVFGPLNTAQRDATTKLLEGATRLERIIEELLDMNKLRTGQLDVKPEPVFYPGLLANLLESMEPMARGKKIRIETRALQPAWVLADPDRLHQIVRNLLSNALKFTPDGGRIAVSLRVPEGASCVETRIADNGIGIPETEQERIFEPFHQVDSSSTRRYGGTGLGLAIVKSLVEQMDGTLGVESRPGQGATFWFRLPLVEAPRPARQRPF